MEKFPEILRLRVGEYICIYNRYKKGTFLPVPKLTFKCRPLRRHYSGYEGIPIKNPLSWRKPTHPAVVSIMYESPEKLLELNRQLVYHK